MARPVTPFTGQWADLPLAELAPKAKDFGYDGLELACWGDHLDIEKAAADPGYCEGQRDLLRRHGLGCWAISAHLQGQLVLDPIDRRNAGFAPPDLGDDPEKVREDRKSTRLNFSHLGISYAVFCLKKKKQRTS